MTATQTPRRPPMDVAGMAVYCGTSERKIRRLVHERKVPFLHLGGKLRFLPDRVDTWLDELAVEPEDR